MMATVLGEFRIDVRRSPELLESRSGTEVNSVCMTKGQAVYLKVTDAVVGAGALTAARRELSFYQTVRSSADAEACRLHGYR
jgi:hypothetical protein